MLNDGNVLKIYFGLVEVNLHGGAHKKRGLTALGLVPVAIVSPTKLEDETSAPFLLHKIRGL